MNKFLASILVSLGLIFGWLTVVITQSGCDKCQTVMPVLVKTTNIVQDAAFALAQVQTIVDTVPMPDNVKVPLRDALSKAGAGLKAANTVLIACTEACKAPDWKAAFAEFNKAWGDIRSLLTLFGKSGKGVEYKAGAAPGTTFLTGQPVVSDPIAFSL